MSLPSGYTKLEWIESTGTQFINTGLKATTATQVVLDIDWKGASTSWMTVFGSYDNGNYFSIWHQNSSDFIAYVQSSNYKTTAGQTNAILELSATEFAVNGTAKSYSAALAASSPMYIFHISGGQDSYAKARMRLYSCQISESSNLLRDYIPAMRNSDGAIGLLDLVNGAFYENSGTGVFTAGPIAEYTWLEWIESDGNSWIDAGFMPNQDSRLIADVEVLQNASTTYSVLGSRAGNSSSHSFCLWVVSDRFRFDFGEGKYDTGIQATGRHEIDLNKNVATIDGISTTASKTTITRISTVKLFAISSGSSIEQRKSVMRLYSCKIYDNDVLVRDFVPAKSADGTIGMYDTITQRIYPNAGSGELTAGPEFVEFEPLSVTSVDNEVVKLPFCKANVDGVEYAISYALVNVDGVEVKILFDKNGYESVS